MNKTVLVSFKERNKVLRISYTNEGGVLACLKEQFCRAFNETISEEELITFQRFDSEWDSFIDLEECDTVNDRDKLRVVVTTRTNCGRGTVNTGSNIYSTQVEHSVSLLPNYN